MIRAYLGGSFDPPHSGHLALLEHAHACLSQLGLAFELSVLPTQGSPFKSTQTPYDTRCQMLSLAIQSMNLPVPICRLEANMTPPVYSVDVFDKLHARHPEDSLILIVGSDSLSQMPKWQRSDELHGLFNLWVFGRDQSRADTNSTDSTDKQTDLIATAAKLNFVVTAELDGIYRSCGALFFDDFTPPAISSSEVRCYVKTSEGSLNLVPKAVARYIEQNSVYL